MRALSRQDRVVALWRGPVPFFCRAAARLLPGHTPAYLLSVHAHPQTVLAVLRARGAHRLYHSVIIAAFAGGPAMGGFVAEVYGAQASFLVVGAAGVLCALGYTLLPETQGRRAREAAGMAGVERDADARKGSLVRELLRRPDQQAIVTATMALNSGYAAAVTILPLHATEVWGANPGQLGVMFSVRRARS